MGYIQSMTYDDSAKSGPVIRNQREVYFLQGELSRLIKIGVANNACKRLRDLAMGSPDRLVLVGLMVCARAGKLEGELHQQFAAHRRHGEWFAPDDEILDYANDWGFFDLNRMVELQSILDCPNHARKVVSKGSGFYRVGTKAHADKLRDLMATQVARYQAREDREALSRAGSP